MTPALATTLNQSASANVAASTYAAAIEHVDQYVTKNVSGEKQADTNCWDCLDADQLGDEDTSYWWNNGYTVLTIMVDMSNISDADVQMPAKATEFVLTNCSERQSRRTTTPAHDDVAVITISRLNSKQSPWTCRWSSILIRPPMTPVQQWYIQHRRTQWTSYGTFIWTFLVRCTSSLSSPTQAS